MAQAVEKDAGPDEIKLLFNTECPKMLQRPHGRCRRVVVKEEERTEDIDSRDSEPSGPAQKEQNGDIDVNRGQNTHGTPEIKAAHADGAAFLLLAQKKGGNEIATDDEEDKYARLAIENCIPNESNMMVDVEPLDSVKSEDEKDR